MTGADRLAAAALAAFLTGCATLPERDLREDLVSLHASERAFALAAGTRGMRAAFLEFLSAEGLIFRPGPVNGRAWFEFQPDRPGLLVWVPVVVEVADAGDLGYTTGPWTFRKDPSSERPDSTGVYVSVWRREPPGLWRVIADIGMPMDLRRPPDPPWSAPAFPMPHAYRVLEDRSREEALVSLTEAEESLALTAKAGGPALAFKTHAAPRIRLHRASGPAVGSAAAALAAGAPGERWTWTVRDAAVSASGDLGWTHGAWQAVCEGAEPSVGAFLRVWRRPPGGTWAVVLDLAVPDPPTPPKETAE